LNVLWSVAAAVASLFVISQGGAAAERGHAASKVPLLVIRAKDGEAVAFVKVVIHGHAYPFLVDTGASGTTIDLALARRLKLKTIGKPTKVFGVGCSSIARKVALSSWRVGHQRLPAIAATATRIAGTMGKPFGLLGSDVFARLGSVKIDYPHSQLTLG
jgi:predicted aspartyl protease